MSIIEYIMVIVYSPFILAGLGLLWITAYVGLPRYYFGPYGQKFMLQFGLFTTLAILGENYFWYLEMGKPLVETFLRIVNHSLIAMLLGIGIMAFELYAKWNNSRKG